MRPGPLGCYAVLRGAYIPSMHRLCLSSVALALTLAACGGRQGDAAETGSPAPLDAAAGEAATGDWVTIDGVDFPERMAKAPPEIQEAYVFAAKHPEVLLHMPCYCGCEQGRPPHISNYDCFVDQIDRSGERPRVDIDDMGFG